MREGKSVTVGVLVIAIAVTASALLGCAKETQAIDSRSDAKVWYTSAAPPSIVSSEGATWFPYGMTINGRSGVGEIRAGVLTDLTRHGPFEVDRVAVGESGAVWYSAYTGTGDSESGEIGLIKKGKFIAIRRFGDAPSDITFDSREKRLLFALPGSNNAGWIDSNGKATMCRLSAFPRRAPHPGAPVRLASSAGVTWFFMEDVRTLTALGHGCAPMATVRFNDGFARTDIQGFVADPHGAVWMLDVRNNVITVVTKEGKTHESMAPLANSTALGIVRGEVCIASHAPTSIACAKHGSWRVHHLPVAGRVASMSYDTTNVWLAYGGLDGEDEGAIVAVPIKDVVAP